MPMLPSGRFVGLDPTPLVDLVEHPDALVNVHRIMAIHAWHDLWALLEVVVAVPDVPGAVRREMPKPVPGSPPLPPGMVAAPSGYRLDRLEELMRDWPADDRAAMSAFVEGRAKDHFANGFLPIVKERQERLLGPGTEPYARALAHCYRLGIHPVQEEWVDELGDDPAWDTCDAIAAVLACHAALAEAPAIPTGYRDAFDRAGAFLGVAMSLVPALMEREGESPRDIASGWRRRAVLGDESADPAHWLRNQAIAECVALMDAGDELRTLSPQGFAMLSLVGLSPEAAAICRPGV